MHPVLVRSFFEGDLELAVRPVIAAIENRLSSQPQASLPSRERPRQIGGALLALTEIEHPGAPGAGTFRERLHGLMDHLLTPLEVQ